MKRLHAALSWLWKTAGFRGAFLAIIAAINFTYGAALIVADPVQAKWWPVTQGALLRIPIHTWGIIWVGVGAFMLIGVFIKNDRFQFAAAIALATIWATIAMTYALIVGAGSGVWGVSAIYAGAALLILLAAAWPEPVDLDADLKEVIGRELGEDHGE